MENWRMEDQTFSFHWQLATDTGNFGQLPGLTSWGRATREAPAQAELRPTCAGAYRFIVLPRRPRWG
jgi:hypothetical protein